MASGFYAWILVALPPLLVVTAWVARTLNWAWWTPRRLERSLRAQGIRGTSFRFPYGDLKLNARLLREARAKPMPLSHDIVPRVVPFFHRAMLEYGKTSLTWIGPTPQVTLMDPELVKEVLFTRYGDFRRPDANPLGKYSIRGLAMYDGEKWVKHRKILNPAFHMEKLKGMLPAFSACCSELMSRWEDMVGSAERYEMDVWQELQTFTVNVISRTAFGSSYEDGTRIFRLQTEQAKLIVQTSQNLHLPGYTLLPTAANKRIKAIDREVREILRAIITKREEEINMGKASNDLLGLLMDSNMKHTQEAGHNSAGMTVDEVMEECKLFYFAGHETTSDLLTWTMIALSMHPSWQFRAREEVIQTFGTNEPNLDGLNHLKIVTMILHEVLRLYPPAVFLLRQTYKTVKLGGLVYPPGVRVGLPIIFIHHSQDLWGKDASEFNPERFAEGISKASKAKDKNVFLPFGFGPRICIGQNFAMLEAKMALCMILQRFSFELSPSYAHAPYTVFTLQPQHGAQLQLRRL